MKLYLSGPMTGYPEHNYPAFKAAAERWRYHLDNVEVFNPAEAFDGDQTLPYTTYMRNDIHLLLQSDAIALLPGWRDSKGSRFELLIAQNLGLAVYNAVTFAKIIAPTVLTVVEASSLSSIPVTGSIPCFCQ